jgi:serine/threonine protein kinase
VCVAAQPARPLSDLIVRISDYKRVAMIGRGSFGAIYSATDLRTGDVVALKLLHDSLVLEQDRVQFDREVEILASLKHPTLLSLRGYVPGDVSKQKKVRCGKIRSVRRI